MAGAHGMRQKGASMYKENVRVSCFISHPDLDNGSETDQLATSIDLIPTLVELAQPGIDWRERWPDLKGVSLTGALSGNSSERDDRGMLLNYCLPTNIRPVLGVKIRRPSISGELVLLAIVIVFR